jgi:hypothetical protein
LAELTLQNAELAAKNESRRTFIMLVLPMYVHSVVRLPSTWQLCCLFQLLPSLL